MTSTRIKHFKKKSFDQPRILIIGCGDVGARLLPLLVHKFRVFALTSQPSKFVQLRDAGAIPIIGNLDQASSLKRLARLAQIIIHLAPPQSTGVHDQRTHNLSAILPDKSRLVYVSTTGVYGDCDSLEFNETRMVNPINARAVRRVSAENILRRWAIRSRSCLSILRVPGIYADNRLPIERLKKGLPALIAQDDVYTNHIHADDLAKIIYLAIFRALPNRIYHAVDDSDMKMGDYFDAVASQLKLPPAPRLARAELEKVVSPTLLSFMSESRRLQNQRIKQELGMRLNYPTINEGIKNIGNV